jgi:trans-2,3-dihydro-3-hydroxyanthranilate isomerase
MRIEKQPLKYCVLDVFTKKRYSGNPLAVVFTEGDLALSFYEDIAREFGYA